MMAKPSELCLYNSFVATVMEYKSIYSHSLDTFILLRNKYTYLINRKRFVVWLTIKIEMGLHGSRVAFFHWNHTSTFSVFVSVNWIVIVCVSWPVLQHILSIISWGQKEMSCCTKRRTTVKYNYLTYFTIFLCWTTVLNGINAGCYAI